MGDPLHELGQAIAPRRTLSEMLKELEPMPAEQPKPAENDLAATLVERGARYGAFVGHAEVTQGLKRFVAAELAKRGKVLADDQQEAMEMILHKLGRIVNGDPDYPDSWVDIAGYAKLVADRLEGLIR